MIICNSVAELQGGIVRDVVSLCLLETDSTYMLPLVVEEGQGKGKKGKFCVVGTYRFCRRRLRN